MINPDKSFLWVFVRFLTFRLASGIAYSNNPRSIAQDMAVEKGCHDRGGGSGGGGAASLPPGDDEGAPCFNRALILLHHFEVLFQGRAGRHNPFQPRRVRKKPRVQANPVTIPPGSVNRDFLSPHAGQGCALLFSALPF